METNDKDELLNKYGRKPYAPLVKPGEVDKANQDEEEDGEIGYRALIEHREKKGNTPRFRVLMANGQSYGCGYAYLLGWLHNPPDTLTFYTTTHSFVLSGKNLQKVENAFLREKIKQLREFNSKLDTMPGDGEPLIEQIVITSRFQE